MTSSVAVGTIAAKNYLSYARVLERSFRKQHPELPLFVLLADEPEGCFDPAAEAFEVLDLDDIGISNLQTVKFQYSRAQLAIAAKPYLLLHLLDGGFDRAVFLDPDILVTGDLTPLLAPEFASSIMLTPHVLSPLSGPDRFGRELSVIRSGVFNGGFIGVSNTEIARGFLQWWSDRVRQHCLHDLPRGIHFDQRWIDLAPCFFDDIAIVRDPACNVAYWNLQERNAQAIGDRVTVDGEPCRFFISADSDLIIRRS